MLRSAMERVCRVAPGASKIAARQPHENARQACTGALALNRFEYFGDYHGKAVDSYAYFITPPHLGLGGTLLRRVTYVTAPIATASSTQPTTNAVRHPHPIVSQKMETRKAGMAMSRSARFISSRFTVRCLTRHFGLLC